MKRRKGFWPWNYWALEVTAWGPVFCILHLGVCHVAWEKGWPPRGVICGWNRD
jgi:hypothetical protein